MNKEFEVADRMRLQLLGALHVGNLRPGARLPSIREVAKQFDLDHRLVQRAYRQLEAERLIEIRGRSGVFVANQPDAEMDRPDDRAQWLAGILTEAWRRRISLAELADLTRATARHGLRCICLESTTDHLIAFAAELADDFGFSTTTLRLTATQGGPLGREEAHRVEAAVRSADMVATTAFHSSAIDALARRANRPLITVAINPVLRDEIALRLRSAPLRVVVADAAFAARARHFVGKIPGSHNVELVLARDWKGGRSADDVSTLFTRAARRALGMPEFHLLSAAVPFIGAESAAEINALITRLTSERAEPQT